MGILASQKCQSCGLGGNPAKALCAKCDKADFLAAVKAGQEPFDFMSAGRVITIALLAFLLAFALPAVLFVAVFLVGCAQGTFTFEMAMATDIDVLLGQAYPGIETVTMVVGQVFTVILVALVARRYLSGIFASFQNYKGLLIATVITLVMFAITSGFNQFVEKVLAVTENENQQLVENELLNPDMGLRIASIVSTVLLAPLLEELTFRCGIQGLLRRKNATMAIIVSAVLFAAIHVDFGAANLTAELLSIPDYLLGGLSMCYIYHKFGFAGSFTAHVVNNGLATVLLFMGF